MNAKLCVACGEDLPVMRRSDRRYCGVRCRVRAYRIRKHVGRKLPHVRRASRRGADVSTPLQPTTAAAAIDELQLQLDNERVEHQKQAVAQESVASELRERLRLAEAAHASALGEIKQLRDDHQNAKNKYTATRDLLTHSRIKEARTQRALDQAREVASTHVKTPKPARSDVGRPRKENHSRAAAQADREELLERRVQELEIRVEEFVAVRRSEVSELNRRLVEPQHHAQRRPIQLTAQQQREPGAVSTGQTRGSFFGEIASAALSGAVTGVLAGVSHRLGKEFIESTSGGRRTLLEPPVPPENVRCVPIDTREEGERLTALPGKLVLTSNSVE